jgi:hypothetical protein
VPADQVEQCTSEESTDGCKSFPVDAVPRKFVAEILDDVSRGLADRNAEG